MKYIKENWQENDFLYVYYMSYYAFEYYSKYHPEKYKFEEDEFIIGRAPRGWYYNYRKPEFKGFWNPEKPFSQPFDSILKEYIEDLDKLKGRGRVWLLFSSNVSKEGIQEESFYIYHLESIGERLDFFGRSGIAAAYLFDLGGKPVMTDN
jgi:hypothetical protein